MDSHTGEIPRNWTGLEQLEANGQFDHDMTDPEAGVPGAPRWSIVIIARNEEANIEACLRSVLEAFEGRDAEIVLVDSASTDRTVKIARRFPVRVICLPPSKHLNPSIGRATGFARTRGRTVLFLDGDCILERDWVELAERALDADTTLGGVAGASHGLLPPGPDGKRRTQDEYPNADYDNPSFLAGSAAYRRAVLENVGCFNPNLYACEEEEFGARVRKGGYRMRRLRETMSQHHPKNAKETTSELIRRLRRRYFIGLGQLVRQTFAHELPITGAVASVSRHLVYFSVLMLGVLSGIASVAATSLVPLGLWLLLMSSAFTLFAVKSRSVTKPAYYFLEWTLASPMVVWGLALPPLAAEWRRPGLEPTVVHEPTDR
ncbi:MAG: glycosyltransferase [Candidatus Binatia bacterium]